MSSEIEYRQIAFSIDATSAFEQFKKLDPAYWPHYDTKIIAVFVEHGASNCTELRNGRELLARSWTLVSVGTTYEVMRDFIERAGEAEGGMIRRNHTHMKAENYIAHWRKQIGEAQPLLNLNRVLSGGNSLTFDTERLIESPSKRSAHPWYAKRKNSEHIVEREGGQIQIQLAYDSDLLNLCCDMAMLSDLRENSSRLTPFGFLKQRKHELFDTFLYKGKTREIFGDD